MQSTQKEIDEALGELVDRILERGRLSELERQGKLGVRDGGITLRRIHFIQELKSFAKAEAISLADMLIGKERAVEMRYADIQDEDPIPNPADLAVVSFQREQRLALSDYQNPVQEVIPPVMHMQLDPIVMTRVDRDKPTMELVGVTGREQFSENEE